MDWKGTRLASIYYRGMDRYIVPHIMHVSPNLISLAGLILAAMVPLACSLSPLLGVLFTGLSGVADSLDGHMARKNGTRLPFGAFLDSIVDRAVDFFFLVGFWILAITSGLGLFFTIGVFCALLVTFMISYTKARLESLGGRCDIGIMDRVGRTLYLMAWGVVVAVYPEVPVVLWGGLAGYVFLTSLTVIQRIACARAAFSDTARWSTRA